MNRTEEYLLISFGKGRFESYSYIYIVSEVLRGFMRSIFKRDLLYNHITEM